MVVSSVILSVIFGYLCGAIPFGLLLTHLAGLEDIRTIGSGNIGATNVLRTGHKRLAVATLLLDAGKGVAAILLTSLLLSAPLAPLAAGLGAFLGHLYPLWLKFKGGKGVAVYIGILLALDPVLGAVFCLLWLSFALITRLSSAGALGASGIVPIIAFFIQSNMLALTCLILSALLWYKHYPNVARILAGQEPKIGEKKAFKDAAK